MENVAHNSGEVESLEHLPLASVGRLRLLYVYNFKPFSIFVFYRQTYAIISEYDKFGISRGRYIMTTVSFAKSLSTGHETETHTERG